MKLDGLPLEIVRPSAWTAESLSDDPESWQYKLSQVDVDDLVVAAHSAARRNLSVRDLNVHTFNLRRFNKHLADLRHKLLHGIGFEIMRGLPIGELDENIVRLVFCGIGAHLGHARPQNAKGDLVGHVRDVGRTSSDPSTRIYQTSERQTFHTDSADVVGLLCVQDAMQGGESLIVSAESIYNRMRRDCPSKLELLFDMVATDRRGEVPRGAEPYFKIPVLNWYRGLLTVIYQRQYIDSAQRFPEVGHLSKRQVQALDLFDQHANDPDLAFTTKLEPGDMQFLYNHSLLHDRTSFRDWPQETSKRHLLRLWLAVDGDRELPEIFKERFGSIEIGDRGGVNTGVVA